VCRAEEAREVDEIEHQLAAAVNPLPPAQRQQVEKARVIAGARAAQVHRLPSTGAVRKMLEPPAIARIGELHAIKGGPATQKMQRDAAQMRALCTATRNAPAGLPSNVCNMPARQ